MASKSEARAQRISELEAELDELYRAEARARGAAVTAHSRTNASRAVDIVRTMQSRPRDGEVVDRLAKKYAISPRRIRQIYREELERESDTATVEVAISDSPATTTEGATQILSPPIIMPQILPPIQLTDALDTLAQLLKSTARSHSDRPRALASTAQAVADRLLHAVDAIRRANPAQPIEATDPESGNSPLP